MSVGVGCHTVPSRIGAQERGVSVGNSFVLFLPVPNAVLAPSPVCIPFPTPTRRPPIMLRQNTFVENFQIVSCCSQLVPQFSRLRLYVSAATQAAVYLDAGKHVLPIQYLPVMNLKLRIGEMLQSRSLSLRGDAGESVAMRIQQREQEDAQRTHMRRLFSARVQELDELRAIMRQRRKWQGGSEAPPPAPRSLPAPLTRPPGGVDGSQLISLINELEVKILSEPMSLNGHPREKLALPLPRRDLPSPVSAQANVPSAHPLDDPALMVAARRWNSAADLLMKTVGCSELSGSIDWTTRSAIDLLERGGQTERAKAMKLQYRQSRGREPAPLLPRPLPAPITGRLHMCRSLPWTSPSRLDLEAVSALQLLLCSAKAGTPVLLDWTGLKSVDVGAIETLRQQMATATRSRLVFVHLGLSSLVRTVRLELQTQNFSRTPWELWLAVLNWAGFRTAHRTAAAAYARRFRCDAPSYLNPLCTCQALNAPPSGALDELVCGVRFIGDLTQEHVDELDRLAGPATSPSKLVVIDLRRLMSMDFFFAAGLLNLIIRRHSQGVTVAIAYAHPLLSHYLQMLGFQNYAKVHGLPVTG